MVDDSEQERIVLTRLLQQMGHTVGQTGNSREALECLTDNNFDLVLLDPIMPEMNGLQVLEHMRSNPLREHIPVLTISELDDMESIIRCVELGAEDYLPKPINETLFRAHVSAALEKKWLRDRERAYLATLRQEMELGRQIQFDVFPLFNAHLSLAIGDVSGKGVGATLFMALIRTLLRALSEYNSGRHDDALNAVRIVNRHILRHHQQRTSMFVTLFLGVLELQTGKLEHINAGHVPAVLSRLDGSQELLFPSGPMVGITDEIPFEKRTTQLDQGDLLLLYTDGVTEAVNAEYQLSSTERLQRLACSGESSPKQLLKSIEAHLTASGEVPFSDDDAGN